MKYFPLKQPIIFLSEYGTPRFLLPIRILLVAANKKGTYTKISHGKINAIITRLICLY